MGDFVDIYRAVCRAIYIDDCMGNCRAVVEVFVENDCETS
jgi:hypothetical protein